MKIPDRLPIKMLAVLLILPFASPYMYTGFQTYGLLYSIDLWVFTVFICMLLGVMLNLTSFLLKLLFSILFSKRSATKRHIRDYAVISIAVAMFFELVALTGHWGSFLDGETPSSRCLLCKIWEAKKSHTQ